jgi:hydrogenase expression/formation protein HypE
MPPYPDPIQAVLFDFDGTLTRPGALDFSTIKTRVGCPAEMPVLEFIQGIRNKDRQTDAWNALEAFETEAAAASAPADGAETLIEFLKATGVFVGIITRNSLASVLRALENFPGTTPGDFDIIISRDDPVAPKPSPEGVLVAAERLGISAGEILVAGDFIFDIQAGQAAGAMTALVDPDGEPNPANRNADVYRVAGLTQLASIVRMGRPLPAGKFPADLLESFFGRFDRSDPSVLIASAVGEDIAALDVEAEQVLILKSDPITFATDAIGDYAVVVNANDIATAGATPRWLLTTILFPCGITAGKALDIMHQLQTVCQRWQITLCGGHTEITDAVNRPVVTGMMAGTVARHRLIRKADIGTGDRLLLTKAIAIEGTAIIAREFSDRLKAFGMAEKEIGICRRMLSDLSVLGEAGIAAESGEVSGMHDVTEGGVATAIEELSAAAGHRIRVELDQIPVMAETRKICRNLGIDPLGLIGSGSLLICCRSEASAQLMADIRKSGIQVTEIGRVTDPGRGIDAFKKGRATPWPKFEVDEIARLFSEG